MAEFMLSNNTYSASQINNFNAFEKHVEFLDKNFFSHLGVGVVLLEP